MYLRSFEAVKNVVTNLQRGMLSRKSLVTTTIEMNQYHLWSEILVEADVQMSQLIKFI